MRQDLDLKSRYCQVVNVSPSNSHSRDINDLGGGYGKLNDGDRLLNYPNRRVRLLFGGGSQAMAGGSRFVSYRR